jgi:hypothetical protein
MLFSPPGDTLATKLTPHESHLSIIEGLRGCDEQSHMNVSLSNYLEALGARKGLWHLSNGDWAQMQSC